ncbi:PD-(D/E)XK motif protein [Actinomadura rudentiformis]|uniref:PD-(D/E)XK motif protein n=1 Tax=Actinomadura rudentiformis TaxID=359158 RepID=A0A6H9YML8_9ACTN|nr:PD-(D/E)XK motif protein [Actinomadura rudentiformis]KAB2340887.1 PD-(D/E)XK motif protein [Actinomadura rudentiformis]
MEYPIEGEPRLSLFIDPSRPAIGLRVPLPKTVALPDAGLEHIRLRRVHAGGLHQAEVAVTDSRSFVDAYPILMAVADRIQLEGRTLDFALTDTLRLLGRLLERRDSFSVEKELGLFGELLFVLGLYDAVGVAEAVAAWRGPEFEEHDFGLRGLDIEVKTTSGERRTHWIDSPSQLQPVAGRALWLVSYQLTAPGAEGGATLPELIQWVRDLLGTAKQSDTLSSCLEGVAWRESYADTCTNRWRHRSKPTAYVVADDLPRITTDLLATAGIDLTRVPELRYRVDLTGLEGDASAPDFLAAALAHGGLG